MTRTFVLLAALAASACTLPPPGPSASLPPDAVVGAGDPVRTAVFQTSAALGAPARLAQNPAAAARTVAQLEYLTVELNSGPRWAGRFALPSQNLREARADWRSAMGIAPSAQPQQVIDGLYAASRALNVGQRGAAAAALSPDVFIGGGEATLQRLAALPPLPRANVAMAQVASNLERREGESRPRF